MNTVKPKKYNLKRFEGIQNNIQKNKNSCKWKLAKIYIYVENHPRMSHVSMVELRRGALAHEVRVGSICLYTFPGWRWQR